MKELAIVIPTYNRNAALNRTIMALLPQMNSEVELIVVDNFSDIPIEKSIKELGIGNDDFIKVIRNKANVGLSANLMKCFEVCDAKWLWILSDDDCPRQDAIEVIFSDLKKENVGIFINYYSSGLGFTRSKNIVTDGVSHFINELDNFSTFLFISNGVYKIENFISYLRWGYQYGNTFAPFMAMILKAIENGERVSMMSSQVVDFIEPEAEQKWSWVNLTLGIPSLLNLPLAIDKRTFSRLASHVYTHVQLDYDFYLALKGMYSVDGDINYKPAYLFKFYLGNTFLRNRDIKSKFVNYLFCQSFESRFAKKVLNMLKGGYLKELEQRIRKGNPDRL